MGNTTPLPYEEKEKAFMSLARWPSDEVKAKIYNVKPGLTGIGSIVFRDEEAILTECVEKGMAIDEAYAKVVSPYKGALEMWYQEHIGFCTDFMLIFLTAWVIVFPESDLVFKVFKDLPKRNVEQMG